MNYLRLYRLSSCLLLLGPFAIHNQIAAEDSTLRWQLQNSGSEASLRGLCVVNRNVVWASGAMGTVLRSGDGGRKWNRVSVPGTSKIDFRDVQAFADGGVILLTAGTPARIYHSSDGRSWKTAFEAKSRSAFFDGMAFWSRQHGIAFSDPVEGRLLIVTTSDGGRNWQTVPQVGLPKTLQGEFGFAASGTSIAVFGDRHAWIGLGGQTTASGARVFRTEDRGQTWSAAVTPLKGGPSAGVFSVVFTDALMGVAVGGDYKKPDSTANNVIVTNDGGRTWTRASGRPPSGFRSSVAVVPHKGKRLHVAVGPNGTDLSQDGGQSWQPMSAIENRRHAFHAVAGVAAAFFSTGADGRIGRLRLR